eukprot:9447643-Pyramimonas_sp.AAC.1
MKEGSLVWNGKRVPRYGGRFSSKLCLRRGRQAVARVELLREDGAGERDRTIQASHYELLAPVQLRRDTI